MQYTVQTDTPTNFNFRATAYSHGWSELRPFELDEDTWRLTYVFSDGNNTVPGVIYDHQGRLRVDLDSTAIDEKKILLDVRHILRLDDELTEFYSSVAVQERLSWIAAKRAGRLVRCPTVWEDLVKTMCTTNCSWGLTKSMVSNLVEKLGHGVSSRKAFPTAEAMASVDEGFYRNEIKAGYRSPYFVELARDVADGKLDPQSWLTSDLPTADLKKEMKKVKGVGDYAAENLLKLVGRYDGLALDSFLRSQFYKTHNNEKPCPDKKIERHYKKFGKWRGLVMWCDMTERWNSIL